MQPGEPEIGKPGHKGPLLWEAAPDIFSALTPFKPGIRSPCFENRTDGALRCLPYFSIIGAQTCQHLGTGFSHAPLSWNSAASVWGAAGLT